MDIKKISLSGKIIIMIIALIFLTAVFAFFDVQMTLHKIMGQQLTQRGISIGRDLAARSADLLFTRNLYALDELLKDTRQNNQDIKYILVFDQKGNLVHSTFGRRLPAGLRNINSIRPGQEKNIVVFSSPDGLIKDIAIPILEGSAGWVRVGMTEYYLQEGLKHVSSRLLLTTGGVSFFGILMAIWLTGVVTKPLKRLVHATQEVAAGNLAIQVPVENSGDDLASLTAAFNEMVAKIRQNQLQLQQYSEELRQKEIIRQQLLAKLIAAQEEERKRIARELHDQASQSLTSLKVALRTFYQQEKEPEHLQYLAEILGMTDNVLDELRSLALELRPSVLDDLGLEEGLKFYLKQWGERHRIDVDLLIDGLDKRLPIHIETAVYRIIQEALTNIAKHAQAENVSIVVRREEKQLKVIIEDDGQGFCLDEALENNIFKKKLGLFGMQERATLLGGEFQIETEPGQGCSIYLRLPLLEGSEVND
ncbi:Uncharacterized signal transduction histidine kinase domain [Carboxydocella sporoproducens DSM 16521]|uniref:histidine kinase n=2 Tax=Carboxydocella TaxID=178898 RepID=A0A1T4Q3W9_9FIRM|nr:MULTISPECIES: histidine kinase [Carboxydocella]AVX21150.1 histidine kinase [Carboxydocella thermautotrophica]AVX31585.1 histidine kinase [Carboxydocella thermautotrophica]SJZ98460.1 Uncharacterized signal transduction histidine kinase domain [Carboxydocella sporoproducens DSM 16521]